MREITTETFFSRDRLVSNMDNPQGQPNSIIEKKKNSTLPKYCKFSVNFKQNSELFNAFFM